MPHVSTHPDSTAYSQSAQSAQSTQQSTPPALTSRLHTLLAAMSTHLLERDAPVRLALLAALAGEHLLLIGPPGTAKSEVARRLQHCFAGGRYFERLLTRFSVPEELFGPLSIAALEDDRYERQTDGFLPSASVAFIDEVFKANSAILNALLTLLNEREFDNGSQRIKTPLISVIGASNEVPNDEALAAFHDRFLLRCPVAPVGDAAFEALLELPRDLSVTVADADKLHTDTLTALQQASAQVRIPPAIVGLLTELREALRQGLDTGWEAADTGEASGTSSTGSVQHSVVHAIDVSDRRWRKIAQLLRVAAASHGRDEVNLWDLSVVRFCIGSTPTDVQAASHWYARRLGTDRAHQPARFEQLLKAFEDQLYVEQTATELNYDSSGKLILEHGRGDRWGGSSARISQSEFMKPRMYGDAHISARVRQTDDLAQRLASTMTAVQAMADAVAQTASTHLWVDDAFRAQATASLAGTLTRLGSLQARIAAVRDGFAALPRHPDRDGEEPEPMAVQAQVQAKVQAQEPSPAGQAQVNTSAAV